MFADRREAGRMLAERLGKYKGKNAIVLAIPRGGVVVAREIADAIDGELDLVISRKIGAPMDPEFAIGAVAPDRSVSINEDVVKEMNVTKGYIDRMARIESLEIFRRMKKYRGSTELPDVKGKIVIVVDDGIATGFTMKVVVEFLRKMKPKSIVIAVPVAPPSSLGELEEGADEVVCIESPQDFGAISEFYGSFPQVEDGEVVKLLTRKP